MRARLSRIIDLIRKGGTLTEVNENYKKAIEEADKIIAALETQKDQSISNPSQT